MTNKLLTSKSWRTRYRSTHNNLLHDFYVPVLSHSHSYHRVAGYFRSTALATASQGFSALVNNGGHIRMVVGADLELSDVHAILAGDAARFAVSLNARLDHPHSWPEATLNGVTLLAWMVEHGFLELRVALRVNTKTGEPLPFASNEDGYVHEKWGLFKDQAGNRLLMNGSLNESKTALLLNAENISVDCDWWSDHCCQRVDDAEDDFEEIWNDRDPGMRVLNLPEAVSEKLIRFSQDVERPIEVDGVSHIRMQVPEPSALERLKFAVLTNAPKMPRGRYVGMMTAPIEPWPHQTIVARRLIEAWPFGFLLCDEVGLGKTIETGLAFRSLLLSGIVKKILISPPASLCRQWQNELKDKFFLPFARAMRGIKPKHEIIYPSSQVIESKTIFDAHLCIVSTGLLARQERQQEIKLSGPWDIALVDEAHYARRSNSREGASAAPVYGRLYRATDQSLKPRCKALWLATATPMQIDPIEVFDLFRLTERVGAFQEDPELVQQYYNIHARLLRDQVVTENEIEFLRKSIQSIGFHDPLLNAYLEQTVIEPRTRSDAKRWLDKGRASPRNLKKLARLIFASAPLSRVMMRHTRSLLEIYRKNGELTANLAHRIILPIPPIQFTAQEQEAYDQLESYCQELEERLSTNLNMRTSTAFYLSFLRLRFASSLYAITRTLKRRRERVDLTLKALKGESVSKLADDGILDSFLNIDDMADDDSVVDALLKNRSEDDLSWELEVLDEMLLTYVYDVSTTSSKMQTLLGIIERSRKDSQRPGRIKQTVIFTRFYDTLTDIVNRLRQISHGFAIGTYSGEGGSFTDLATGQMINVEREAVKRRFLREQIDLLICTDAAAEGLNLQIADLLINFDLPWNPAKVEQRIGRIDRIGQRYQTIYVQNLCYLGSAEEIVYGRLLQRLQKANDIVGRQQISMLPLNESDFLELAEGKIDETEITKRAEERIKLNQRRSESMEIPAQELYGIYKNLSKQHLSQENPAELADIWKVLCQSDYLSRLGCEMVCVNTEKNWRTLQLKGIAGVPDGTALTINRALFDEGTDLLEGKLHFATFGDYVFDTVLQQVSEFELPSCIRLVCITPKGMQNNYIAYLVADKKTGATRLKMITKISEINTVQLDENYKISDQELFQYEEKLKQMAAKEFQLINNSSRLRLENQRAAFAQSVLALGVIYGVLISWKKRGRLQGEFRKDISELETFINKRYGEGGGLSIHNIPKDPMDKTKTARLLFDPQPKIAEETWYLRNAPLPILNSGLAAVKRIADKMKKVQTKLSTDNVMDRIKAEINRAAALIK